MEQISKPLEILVIDDDKMNRDLLGEVLKFYGVTPVLAEDGRKGVEEFEKRFSVGLPYDAVLTDFNMPHLNGSGVVREIKRLSPKTPIYVISGEDLQYLQRILKPEINGQSPDGILQKPFDHKLIRSIIEGVKYKKYHHESGLQS